MISNQEDDEFVAVRVQDPRVQNEGSWNSYVDYKIFLHTNSKAFTAKTSCVRRRYSEFVWLRKKLQKNAGLVPVPDLPGKSFFSFSNEDFLEGRRKGLQVFLDKVVHMTVCLSDSQLHLFLQTQLPVGHIQDCVQGHTPYSVTDAILTYASSNRGFAQAQEEDAIKEPSLTVSYESMESPAPHQPCPQTQDTFSPELLSCSESDRLEGLLESCDKDTAELKLKDQSSIKVPQKSNHLEAVVDVSNPGEASFFVGESPPEQNQLRSCVIQTPVEVHLPKGTSFEEESVMMLHTEEKTENCQATEEKGESERPVEANVVNSETEKCLNMEAILDVTDCDVGSQEVVQEDVCSEVQVLENDLISEDNADDFIGGTEGQVADINSQEELPSSDGQEEPENEKSEEQEQQEETPVEPEIHEEPPNEENINEDSGAEQTDQERAEEEDFHRTKDESDEESRSLPSSNGSIVKVSDEESICDEVQEENGFLKTLPEDGTNWSEEEPSSGHILDLHINGCPEEKEDIPTEDLQYTNDSGDFSKSLELNSAVNGGDLTENSDFSVIETSCSPVLTDSKCAEQDNVDVSEEAHEVEVHQLDS
ncbi:sorting nexin-11 [Cheilinus undulatus]|uniref:sorting nexin-11 n=1 Tax=Cheilinus undulatus TaxID=241271 RepID=UPI001BD4881C|nr:sorting nexin-11 [Cheilinus undulatus]XP_041671448.1 sorting nexin-11 [Cheilinus undulatus]XP_041671449.1 sorting nexin-11 [Cheilinus undulatus]